MNKDKSKIGRKEERERESRERENLERVRETEHLVQYYLWGKAIKIVPNFPSDAFSVHALCDLLMLSCSSNFHPGQLLLVFKSLASFPSRNTNLLINSISSDSLFLRRRDCQQKQNLLDTNTLLDLQ